MTRSSRVAIILLVIALAVALLSSAFDQITTAPILTRDLNSQDDVGNVTVNVPTVPDLNGTGNVPDLPVLNITNPVGPSSGNVNGSSINGTVFTDLDKDGVIDPNEVLSGAGIDLYDRNGTLVATTQTGPDGRFNITGLGPGVYNITAVPGNCTDCSGFGNTTVDLTNGTSIDNVTIPLDQTQGASPYISTVTEITDAQSLVVKGEPFVVKGTVVTSGGSPVSGPSVMMYVTDDKVNGTRTFIGYGKAENGAFQISCIIPDDLILGEYQLIASTLANDIYKASESDPTIKVMDESRIAIDCADRVVLNKSTAVTVTLFERSSNRTVSDATIIVNSVHYVTDANGQCVVTMTWTSPGEKLINAGFNGNDGLYGSTANKTVTVLDVTVDIAPSCATRGMNNTIHVLVHASEIPLRNQTVDAYLLGGAIGVYRTDPDGRFNLTLYMPSGQALGNVTLYFPIIGVKLCETELTVRSMTTLMVESQGDSAKATLLNDENELLAEELTLITPDGNRTVFTSNTTSTVFHMSGGSEAYYILEFSGTDQDAPTSAYVHYIPGTSGGSDWMLWLIIALIAVAAAALAIYFFRRRKAPIVVHEPSQGPPEAGLATSPYGLTFPQIEEGLPPVWGTGEPLIAKLAGEKGAESLVIDGAAIDLSKVNGQDQFEFALAKGDHLFSVIGPLGRTDIVVRSVDYREEMVSLYRADFESWKQKIPGLADSVTPREFQCKVDAAIDPSLKDHLETVVSLFEVAEFSLRPVGRSEYVCMFLSGSRLGG